MKTLTLFIALLACNAFGIGSTNVFIAFEGDSLTEGSGASPQASSNYVAQMNLTALYGTAVTNLGHGGDYIYNNTNASDTLIQLTNHSGYGKLVAVLWMGLNDASLYSGAEDAGSIQTAANVISTNTLLWVVNVKASFPACHIMLMTHPACSLYWTKNAILTNVNNWIRSSGAAEVVNDLRADSRFTNPADTTYYNADGIHLNNIGYQLVAGIVTTNLISNGLLDYVPTGVAIANIGTLNLR